MSMRKILINTITIFFKRECQFRAQLWVGCHFTHLTHAVFEGVHASWGVCHRDRHRPPGQVQGHLNVLLTSDFLHKLEL